MGCKDPGCGQCKFIEYVRLFCSASDFVVISTGNSVLVFLLSVLEIVARILDIQIPVIEKTTGDLMDRRIKASDSGANEKDMKSGVTTVSQLVPLVHRLAGRFRRDTFSLADREDIRQEGFVGLLQARRRYESDRGCSFSTYGGRRAGGAMMDYVRTLYRKSRERACPTIPIDDMTYRTGHGEFDSPHSVESGVVLLRFRQFLGTDSSGLDFLSPQEKQVLILRFFQGKTCREAAVAMEVSPATICRVERRALERVRIQFSSSVEGEMDLARAGFAGRSQDREIRKDSHKEKRPSEAVCEKGGDDTDRTTFSRIMASLTL